MVTEFSKLSRPSRTLFGLSPWLIVGVSVILGLAVLILALRDTEREKRRMEENLVDRANALIWALEAGTRTWLGYEGDRNVVQLLVDETARQPGIVYMAVVDFGGKVLAHSDPAKVGGTVDRQYLPETDGSEVYGWREKPEGDVPVFEVYRQFAPIRDAGGDHGGDSGHHGRGRMRQMRQMRSSGGMGGYSATMPSMVMVGLDLRPFQEALLADYHNTVLSAAIVAALGLTGFISMFWAHNYRRSNRMLMDTRALAAEVITSLPMGLITSDTGGRIDIANAAAAAMLGRERRELAGAELSAIPVLDWNAVIRELDRGSKVLERETELTLPGGEIVPINLSASQIRNAEDALLGHIFILGDIAEVKRLQSEVQRNERLTALGNLAAGVAHEIRNPLSTIKGLATYMARKLPSGGGEEEAAKTMIQEVNRLNTVVSELLEFARPSVAKDADADVNGVIARALRLADADLKGKNITVDFQPGSATPPVRINPERFTQALFNLILNAVQAMPAGGTLRIATEHRPAAGDFRVVVEDNGAGMDETVRKAIFNPYFTTKPNGTGLGLAIVHQIVEGHGGSVSVRSAPGAGAAFTIHLPVQKA